MEKQWWKEAVIYQVYTRSFYDSNGDGIGDIPGITAKLDYLKALGVDVLWISPCFQSPNADNGYDISDYYSIQNEFGSLEDLKKLIREAKQRGIQILLDLVLNHTSDQHPWFLESKKSKDNPYRDYYIWRPGRDGKEPNNWGSFFKGSAWELDETTGEYYLHIFSRQQPDLNWECPALREELYKIIHYWLSLGVGGFRLDAINYIKKPENLPDSLLEPDASGYCIDTSLYANNPGLTDFFREMHQKAWGGQDIMTVGECADLTPERAVAYVDQKDDLLSMVFNVELAFMRENFNWPTFKRTQRAFIQALEGRGRNSQFLQNHDVARRLTLLGDTGKYYQESAKMLATIVHTLPGTPYIYQGEEIGMTNRKFQSIHEFDDLFCKNEYRELLDKGWSSEEAMKLLNLYSRDHARTPMQWSSQENAGFTTGTPWLKVNENYPCVNTESQMQQANGIFSYYQKLIALRKSTPALVYGAFREYLEEDPNLYVYTRTLAEDTLLITINFTNQPQSLSLPFHPENLLLLLCNYAAQAPGQQLLLRPYEACIWKIQ